MIESFANGLAGKGKEINTTLNNLSQALNALNEGRGDFFAVVRSLALFVNALHQDDQQFVALNPNLAQLTTRLAGSDSELANAVQEVDGLLSTLRPFLDKNREVLVQDINNLETATNTLLQPEPLNGLETALHVLPTAAANVNQIYHPSHGAVVAIPSITASQTRCSSSAARFRPAAGSGIKNPPNFARNIWRRSLMRSSSTTCRSVLNLFSTAETLPKEIAYSEPRLQPPNGYKDTTVPGIWVPDTPLSHRNTQPGWIVAPGMQGSAGRAGHRGPDDPGLAGRTDGWPQHRTRSIKPADPAGIAERLRREPDSAAHWRAASTGADTAAATGTGSGPGARRPDARAGRRTRTQRGWAC